MDLDIDKATDFMAFVVERHRVWGQRQAGTEQPWTDDPILAANKFTNVYRILDHDSQWLAINLIDPDLDPRTQLMRLFLFRHTGQVEAWEHLRRELGHFPEDVSEVDVIEDIWREYRADGGKLFTPAYIVWPGVAGPESEGTDKATHVLNHVRRLLVPWSDQDCFPDFLAADTHLGKFKALRRNRGIADFMSMQILTDWGYTPQCGVDRENDMVVPGPGSVRGTKAFAPDGNPVEVIQYARKAILAEGSVDLYGRPPSLMDVQNCFCEFSKYVRFQGRPIKETLYKPAHPGKQPLPVVPDHWFI